MINMVILSNPGKDGETIVYACDDCVNKHLAPVNVPGCDCVDCEGEDWTLADCDYCKGVEDV